MCVVIFLDTMPGPTRTMCRKPRLDRHEARKFVDDIVYDIRHSMMSDYRTFTVAALSVDVRRLSEHAAPSLRIAPRPARRSPRSWIRSRY